MSYRSVEEKFSDDVETILTPSLSQAVNTFHGLTMQQIFEVGSSKNKITKRILFSDFLNHSKCFCIT